MTEEEFLKLSSKERADFINTELEKGKNLAEIAKEHFDKSRSWLSKKLNDSGYFNNSGKKYVLSENMIPAELYELLEYKDQLIELVTSRGNAEQPDLSLIEKYENADLESRTFKLPVSLIEEFNEVGTKLRLSKQDLCTLAIAHFVQQHKKQ